MKIAIDIMSGDNPSQELLKGVIDAVNEYDYDVAVIGDEELIKSELVNYNYNTQKVTIIASNEIIGMEESPLKMLKVKKSASVNVAAKAVRSGICNAFISPGNTGATVAAALMNLGRLKGILKPTLAVSIPTIKKNKISILVDGGAYPECNPINLVQYAIMGEIYAQKILGIRNPRIALLNIGEEEAKGSELVTKTYKMLKKIPFNFIGNIESRGIMKDEADVIVTDGFTGNVLIKAIEGVGSGVFNIVKASMKKSFIAKVGAVLMGEIFKTMKEKMDYKEYGAAPLLGIKSGCFISHGSSKAGAIKSAIRVAGIFIEEQINKIIITKLKRYGLNKMRYVFKDFNELKKIS